MNKSVHASIISPFGRHCPKFPHLRHFGGFVDDEQQQQRVLLFFVCGHHRNVQKHVLLDSASGLTCVSTHLVKQSLTRTRHDTLAFLHTFYIYSHTNGVCPSSKTSQGPHPHHHQFESIRYFALSLTPAKHAYTNNMIHDTPFFPASSRR